MTTNSAQSSAQNRHHTFASGFPCSVDWEFWLSIAVQRDGPNGLDRADILLLAKDEKVENILHATSSTSTAPCRRPEGWHPRGSRHSKRGDSLGLGLMLDQLAQREREGIDRTDIFLLAKDEAGENILHAACAYGNASE